MSTKMAEIIRGLRERRGITQKELGEVIGVKDPAIRSYESGNVENIPRSSVIKMAEYFGVSPCYIMGFDSSESVGLTKDEKEYLALYRQLDERDKGVVWGSTQSLLQSEKYHLKKDSRDSGSSMVA